MTRFQDPARVYVVTDFVVGLSFALAWTLLGLYYVQMAGLTPLQLLVDAALKACGWPSPWPRWCACPCCL